MNQWKQIIEFEGLSRRSDLTQSSRLPRFARNDIPNQGLHRRSDPTAQANNLVSKAITLKYYGYSFLLLFFISSCSLFKKTPKYSKVSAEIIETARKYTGTPYRSGGTDRRGMDCSGLIITSFKEVGLQMPRISWQQAEVGKEIRLRDARPGDLVFFVTGKKGAAPINHAGIVTRIKGNEIWFIHASTSKGVREDNLQTDYWKSAFARITRPF